VFERVGWKGTEEGFFVGLFNAPFFDLCIYMRTYIHSLLVRKLFTYPLQGTYLICRY
jgi:hypothetical protein